MRHALSTWQILALTLATAASCGGGDDQDTADAGPPDAGFPADERPAKRSDVAGVADPATGTIAVFGGDDGPIVNQQPMASYLGDTWVLDPDSGWAEVTGAAPSDRGRYAVAHDGAGGMWLFGGRWRETGASGNYTLYADLWSFDFADRTWTMVDDGAGGPSPRYFPAAAHDGDTFYVWGGDTNPSALTITPSEELWSYSAAAGWMQTPTSGTAPSPRLFVAYAHDATRGQLVVFGGQVGDFTTPAFNDLYAVDLATGAWTQLHDGSGTAPTGRFSAMLLHDAGRDRYVMFGGHADGGVTNDAWAFDPVDGTWSELRGGDTFTGAALGCNGNPREIPTDYMDQDLTAPERRSGGVFTMLGDTYWLFGGESDCSDHLDDTWTLSPDGTWTEQIEARTGESCARRVDACQCLCL